MELFFPNPPRQRGTLYPSLTLRVGINSQPIRETSVISTDCLRKFRGAKRDCGECVQLFDRYKFVAGKQRLAKYGPRLQFFNSHIRGGHVLVQDGIARGSCFLNPRCFLSDKAR